MPSFFCKQPVGKVLAARTHDRNHDREFMVPFRISLSLVTNKHIKDENTTETFNYGNPYSFP